MNWLMNGVISLIICFMVASCANQPEQLPESAQQNFGAPGLTAPDDIYCPDGYSYDHTFHQCYGKPGVLGPFPHSMVSKCKSFGGGGPCEGLHWEREFAQELRGQELCPVGSSWESNLSVCADEYHVYGPFLKTQHDACIKAGGANACETMRWSRSFFTSMRTGAHQPAPSPSTPNPNPPIPDQSERTFNFPEPTDNQIARVRSAWATYYKIPTFRDAGEQGYPLLDMAGRSLGVTLKSEDWCHASLEGSVRVLSHGGVSTVFNYVGSHEERRQVDCSPWISLPGLGYSRFYRAKGPFGDGVNGYLLQPHRSIAVDPDWVAYGTVLYVPAARGTAITMPDGRIEVHDGYFFAADTGGALYGNHIDVFIGSAETTPYKFVRSSKSFPFEIYVIQSQTIKETLEKQHKSGR